MYIMCVILCLFSALSNRVGTLQMYIIIIILRRRSNPTKKCHKKAENYDNNAMHFKTEKVLQHSASPSLVGCLGTRYAFPGRYSSRKEPFLSVCAVLSCVQTMVWLPEFLTCTQMLMHAIAHGGCTDTVRESALKFGSGRKIPSRPRDSNPRQHCACVQVLSGTFFVLLERPPRDLLMRDLPDESLFIYFISYINVSM